MASFEISKWWQGTNCARCKSKLGILDGKHNCRSCGQIFCSRCSYPNINVPQFRGPVRLCISCGHKYMTPTYDVRQEPSRPIGWNPNAAQPKTEVNDADSEIQEEQELKEQEDLELALALSRSEAEAKIAIDEKHHLYPVTDNELKEKIRLQGLMNMDEGVQLAHLMSMRDAKPKERTKVKEVPAVTPTLSLYLDRSYWEKKKINNETGEKLNVGGQVTMAEQEENSDEVSEICTKANEHIESLKNRMQSALLRHGSISNDSGIRSLATRLINCHGHVLSMLTKIEADQEFFGNLLKRITYIKESRELLQKLRSEYAYEKEEVRKRAEESTRLKLQHQLERVQHGLYGSQPQMPVSPLQQLSDKHIGFVGFENSPTKQLDDLVGSKEIVLQQNDGAEECSHITQAN
uniref:FYVE-type domain-containing protein n=1 Tax=Ditylenchus dipsaci TaxID=166011 RepID=A0A915EDP9_9BILA